MPELLHTHILFLYLPQTNQKIHHRQHQHPANLHLVKPWQPQPCRPTRTLPRGPSIIHQLHRVMFLSIKQTVSTVMFFNALHAGKNCSLHFQNVFGIFPSKWGLTFHANCIVNLHEVSNCIFWEKLEKVLPICLLRNLPRAAEDKLMIFFLFFLEKWMWHFMQIVS